MADVFSLFSGIGGLDLGLHRAGWNHVAFCESDEWRRSVLSQHWPGVPIYEDVRLVGEPAGRTPADGRGAPVDLGRWEAGAGLLCGGFPCQDVSVAGRRAGLAGERSGLFFEFARIAGTLRPRWILVENVPGLLSSNGGRDFGAVLETLADLGYGVAWRVLDSRYFGVPQRRRRVFIVGALADRDPRAAAERASEVLAVDTRCGRHPAAGTQKGPDIAYALADGSGTRTGSGRDGQDTFVPHYYVEDFEDGTLTSSTGRIDRHPLLPSVAVRRLTPTECERLQALPDGWTAFGPDSRRYAALGDAVTASVAEWIGRRILQVAA